MNFGGSLSCFGYNFLPCYSVFYWCTPRRSWFRSNGWSWYGNTRFVFHLQPTAPPIDVMLMILAVITAAGALQAAGGMDYLVHLAEKALRKIQSVLLFAPIVTYLFTLCAGTGHVAYSVLPVIAEVSRESGIRPERPMSIAVIASQQAITASPISAATVALLAMLADYKITLLDILKVSIPSTFIACMLAAFVASKMGKELNEDPEYLKRLKEGMIPA